MSLTEHNLLAYCLKHGYLGMTQVEDLLALRKDGQSILGPLARTLGWNKSQLRQVLLAARKDNSGNRHDDSALRADRQQLGNYRLVQKLGSGGMGTVYRAYHISLASTFAIKVLHTTAVSPEQLERFHQEARIASRLKHPNIVRVYDAGVVAGQHYIVMEYIAGQNLQQLLADGPLGVRRAFGLLLQLARALEYAHSQKVIHRDIKPANIMITAQDTPYLMDFGLATVLTQSVHLTRSVQVLGTPQYMSPEQALGRTRQLDALSDVYSLGAVGYEMVTGKSVVSGQNTAQVLYKVAYEAVGPPSQYNHTISRDAQAILLKCLEKERGQRFQNMSLLCADIERYLRGEAILSRPSSLGYQCYRWVRRNRLLFGVLLLAVLGLATLTGLLVISKWQDMQRLQRTTQRLEQALAQSQKIRRKLQQALVQVRQAQELAQRTHREKKRQQTVQRILDMAQLWSEQGQALNKIEAQLREAARQLPLYGPIYRVWGYIYYDYVRRHPAASAKYLPQALRYLKKAVRLDADDYLAWFYQYLIYHWQGQSERAEKCLWQLVALAPQNEYGVFGRGMQIQKRLLATKLSSAQRRTLQLQAVAAYSASIKYNDRFAWPYNNRGTIYFNLGKYRQALADYNQAIACDPQLVSAYINRGVLYQQQHQYHQALGDYNQAIRLNPKIIRAYNNRGNLYSNTGQYRQGMADYNHALALQPRYVRAYYNRGNLYHKLHQLRAELNDYNKALQIDPYDGPCYTNRGMVYFYRGQYAQAIQDLERSWQLGVHHPMIKYFLQKARHALGKQKR